MYESYWQLRCNPFENHGDPAAFYASETHQAAVLKLRYLVEHRKGAGLLVGDTGSGKTWLIHMLAAQLAESDGPLVPLVFPQMSAPELLAYLAVELGAPESTVGGGLDRTVRQIEQLLRQFGQRGKHPLIVVDEAHLIDDMRVFQSLRLLLNFQHAGGAPFTLILAGQRELISRLQRLPQLEERIGVKCLLRPLTYEETLGYVTHRLEVAGASRPLFDPGAFDALFELSGGVPRRINRLCDLALLVGFADGSTSLCAEQLEAVAEELATVVPD